MKDSRIPGLFAMPLAERIDTLLSRHWLDAEAAASLAGAAAILSPETADKMIENVIGVFGLPLAVAPNFRVNGRDYVVPMVVEEPSIIAAVSGAAKLARASGGFTVEVGEMLLAGQVLLTEVEDVPSAVMRLEGARDELVALANRQQPNLAARGGGARDIEIFETHIEGSGQAQDTTAVVVHLLVDTRDAMGANTVNSMCEGIAARIEELSGGTALLRILTNLADRCLVTARMTIPLKDLAAGGGEAERVRDAIVLATAFARADRHRAATHNKGIMNGIDAVAIATGNDWRAIEAAAHAYAARDGAYRSLTDWTVDGDANLEGQLVVPLKVGTVGGSLQTNPAVALCLAIIGTNSARELAGLMAAVGLAQNFAALRALVTDGIQEGHMKLHARSVAASAGTPPRHFDAVVKGLIDSGDIKIRKAKDLVAGLVARNAESFEVHGSAAGKVILLGEHAAVYGRHVLAIPIESAITVSLRETRGEMRLEFLDGDGGFSEDESTPAVMTDLVDLILGQLGLGKTGFYVRVRSTIPRAAGLGSSAAVAVAVIRAFDNLYSLGLNSESINRIAFECEKLAHGNPSGIDNTVATYAQAMLYRKDAEQPVKALHLRENPPLVIATSGISASTKLQVEAVRLRRERMRSHYDAIFDEIDTLSRQGAEALVRADYQYLGLLMNVCHGLLNAIGVSTPELEHMVGIARQSGAVGAKLTGAGGGGAIVALCPASRNGVAQALQSAGYHVI